MVGSKSNNIIVFVFSANQKIKEIMEKVDFIENITKIQLNLLFLVL
jgi:hypothetical protein